jgi:single-stranded-DNA-specific exonuclease
LATYLEGSNTTRQTLERRMTTLAKELVESGGYSDDPAIVLGSAEWHPGVVGIVAGRLAEQYSRPVLLCVLNDQGKPCTGSGRSVAHFSLNTALAACEQHLLAYGGHAAAVGFKVLAENLDALRECFCAVVAQSFPTGPVAPILHLDSELPLAALSFKLLAEIDKLEPYGADNPRPRFLASGLTLANEPKRIGVGERHLSFRVEQHGTSLRAVAWGMGDRLDELQSGGGELSVVFTPKINEWNGRKNLEIEVIDFQPTANPTLG